jgi:hypothetical protein
MAAETRVMVRDNDQMDGARSDLLLAPRTAVGPVSGHLPDAKALRLGPGRSHPGRAQGPRGRLPVSGGLVAARHRRIIARGRG